MKTMGTPVAVARAVALAVAISAALATPAAAHVVWIEIAPSGAPGRPQRVEVVFGEPQESLREETGGRLDQHDELQAVAIEPQGRRRALELRKEVSGFGGDFTPRVPGRHNVVATSFRHPVQPAASGRAATKPMYYARAQTLSFQRGRVSEREPELGASSELDIVPVSRGLDPVRGSIAPRVDGEITVRVMFKGRPLVKTRITAVAPNGWMRELPTTDSWGVTSFVPLWPGRYVLLVDHDEAAPGTFAGVAYEVIGHRATLSLTVDPAGAPVPTAPAR